MRFLVPADHPAGRSRAIADADKAPGLDDDLWFFALLQRNVLDRRRWSSREELRLAIVGWIETTYHRRRRQRGLGRLTPVEYETLHQTAHAA